jgi:glycosyltransferase involved in cell wall biosynthesis
VPRCTRRPEILVLSSLFPSPQEPLAGIFIKERMFRVATRLPVTVVSPVNWSPADSLIRRWRPHFRLTQAADTIDQGIPVLRPRFFSVPGSILLDGAGMAAAVRGTVDRVTSAGGPWIIDAHFAYPDGYAASLLSRQAGLPYTVTLRGTEIRHSRIPAIRRRIIATLGGAQRVFAVSDSLRRVALELGVPADRAIVIPNGVDTERFRPMSRDEARRQLGIPQDSRVLVSVGGLVPRKGYHRVIARLPRLRRQWGNVIYLAVGGASREGDHTGALKAQAREAGVGEHVRFLGALAPEALRVPLSAADVLVLASSNEGWANVLLEAMACGIPVVASDVAGNLEVVADDRVGLIFKLGDAEALDAALDLALGRQWDRDAIIAFARRHSWESRVEKLVAEFTAIAAAAAGAPPRQAQDGHP